MIPERLQRDRDRLHCLFRGLVHPEGTNFVVVVVGHHGRQPDQFGECWTLSLKIRILDYCLFKFILKVILEVGEWRGFLSEEDKEYVRENGLESLMHSGERNEPHCPASAEFFIHFDFLAYVCTTIGTVVAMIAAFLASQQTFCFLQLRGKDKSDKNNSNVDKIDSDTILRKVKDDLDWIRIVGLTLILSGSAGPRETPRWRFEFENPNRAGTSSILVKQSQVIL